MVPQISAAAPRFFDLAVEAKDLLKADETPQGVAQTVQETAAFKKTVITIADAAGAAAMGRPVGTYVTIDAKGDLAAVETDVVAAVAESVGAMLPADPLAPVLVCGVGNPALAADALGSAVVAKLIATRSLTSDPGLRSVALMTPDVLGNTGIEAAEIIGAVVRAIEPAALIVIDALATTAMTRLGTSFQVTDTGLAPGGGVGNARPAIDREALAIPVIAVGVPTVIYPRAIVETAFSRLKREMKDAPSLFKEGASTKLIEEIASETDLFAVTPKNVDAVVAAVAETLAGAVATALYDEVSADNFRSYLRR